MVFRQMGEAFQIFKPDNKGRFHLLPNAKNRRIDLCVDALSSRNFRFFKYNLSRKAAEVGGAAFVLAMIEALKQFTIQPDYLHEVRMHQNASIWNSKYGCFLQPFLVHLGLKRIPGQPDKKNMQGHESFLLLTYDTLRRLMFKRILESPNGIGD